MVSNRRFHISWQTRSRGHEEENQIIYIDHHLTAAHRYRYTVLVTPEKFRNKEKKERKNSKKPTLDEL